MQTQFWDTNPPTGPVDSWTVHGLWPDNCDGTYQANCDPNRAFTNITQILQSGGQEGQDTLSYMQTYWKDYQGNDESFWEHEWAKHGTCISTIDPSCFAGSSTKGTDGVVPYFHQAVQLFKTLPTYQWLSNAGIVPSNTAKYNTADVVAALKQNYGYAPYVGCSNGALDEVWYFYNVQGSVIDGKFDPTDIVGSSGSCGATLMYLPKSSGSSTTMTTTTTTKAASTSTASAFSGKGYLNVSKGGCLISTGKWYKSGTCATFTAQQSSSNQFTLTSSKGPCKLVSSEFVCASGQTATTFTSTNGELGDGSGYSADSDISGSTQASVYQGTGHSLKLSITWQSQ